MKRIVVLFVWLLLVPTIVQADESATNNRWWLNVGFLGAFEGKNGSGAGGTGSVSVEHNGGIFTLRRSDYETGPTIWEQIGDCLTSLFFVCDTGGGGSVEEWGLLYGKWFADGKVSLSAGISQLKGDDVGDNKEDFTTWGIPFEVNSAIAEGRYAGVGVSFLGNLNSKESFVGVFLTFQLGRLAR